MSNAVKASLEENMEHILENLPKEFHEDLKKSVSEAAPIPKLSAAEAKKEAIECVKENNSIIEEEGVAAIENDGGFDASVQASSASASEDEQKEILAETEGVIKSRLDADLDACPNN